MSNWQRNACYFFLIVAGGDLIQDIATGNPNPSITRIDAMFVFMYVLFIGMSRERK